MSSETKAKGTKRQRQRKQQGKDRRFQNQLGDLDIGDDLTSEGDAGSSTVVPGATPEGTRRRSQRLAKMAEQQPHPTDNVLDSAESEESEDDAAPDVTIPATTIDTRRKFFLIAHKAFSEVSIPHGSGSRSCHVD